MNRAKIRVYAKKSLKNVKEPTSPAAAVTYSQMLNQDNSMLLEIIDEIDANPSTSKKRSITMSDDEITKAYDDFKIPTPLKKPKSDVTIEAITLPKEENLSQHLFSTYNQCQLTQTNDCLNDFRFCDDIEEIIDNPETGSQYIQRKHEKPAPVDDTLEELFNNAQPEESIAAEVVEEKEKVSEYQAVLDEDCDVFLNIDEEVLKREMKEAEKPKISVKIQKPFQKRDRPKLLPVSISYFKEQGPFFGLKKSCRDFILKTKNIEDLYDWQKECLNLRAIHDRTNLIYALPTSGGKTLVAEIAMFREILLRNKNVIFVLPYVSIVQEKVQDLMPFAVEFKFLVEEYCAGKGSIPPVRRRKKNAIYICTIEKSQILFDSLHENGRLNEVGLIVVDELHMVGDEHRGFSLETLLAKAVFHETARIQVIGMSATISNLPEIAKFLKADVYSRDFRPVELTEYVKIGSEILTINPTAKYISEAFTKVRNFGDDYNQILLRRDPDHIAGLVLEVCPKLQCLVFCATKQNCENVADLVADLMPRECTKLKRDEKKNLIECIKADSNGRICPVLARTIPFGVAYHHSGLTNDERKHLEEAYRLNIICLICCTSTLAAGVNLPAKRVIIRSPFIGRNFLTLTRYKQMVGRAGRAGKCESGESIMICDPKDHQKLMDLLCSKMDETVSGFVQDSSGKLVQTVVLNLIGTKLASTIDELVKFYQHTLLNEQIERCERSLREIIVKCVRNLMEEGAVTHKSTSSGFRNASFVVVGENEIFPDDLLEVSLLGKAAVNSGMSLEDAKVVQDDLRKANKGLVLSQDLHLLFIVVPNECTEQVKPNYSKYGSILINMKEPFVNTRNVIGISESLACKVNTKPNLIKESEKLLLNRFFVALILFELWNSKNIYDVAKQFDVNRGFVYGLMGSASSKAFSVYKFTEGFEEFWVFKEILEKFSKRLAYCCAAELLPLMELPAVKIGRAKLLYAAGFKTVESLAVIPPDELVKTIKNLNTRQAEQIIKAAKHSMIEKMETIQENLEEMKSNLKQSTKRPL